LPFGGRFFKEIPLPLQVSYVHPEYKFVGWSDGDKNMIKNYTGSNTDSVNLKLKFEKTKKSSYFHEWKIACIKPGNKEINPWILLTAEKGGEEAFTGFINFPGLKTVHKIAWYSKQNKVVITRDSTVWRKAHPKYTSCIIEIQGLELSSASTECYLIDTNNEIIDNVKHASTTLVSKNNEFYLIRNGDMLDYSVVEPEIYTITKGKTSSNVIIYFIVPFILLGTVILLMKIHFNHRKKILDQKHNKVNTN
jgi:hypothetical protein